MHMTLTGCRLLSALRGCRGRRGCPPARGGLTGGQVCERAADGHSVSVRCALGIWRLAGGVLCAGTARCPALIYAGPHPSAQRPLQRYITVSQRATIYALFR